MCDTSVMQIPEKSPIHKNVALPALSEDFVIA